MTILNNLLPTLYGIRGFLDKTVGARPYSVTAINEIRTNRWDGSDPIDTIITPILEGISPNNGNPKVVFTSHDDYIRGAPSDAELTVGPITPAHEVGGVLYGTEYSVLEPGQGNLYFRVDGPGIDNVKYLKAGFVGEKTLSWYLYLKRAGNE
ncbi:MAG: hypothetical protein WC942_08895 [Clostridia bacterium]|jgi:hypothetical protein